MACKKHKKLSVILIAVSIIIVAACAVTIVTLSSSDSPQTEVFNAIRTTLFESNEYKIGIDITGENNYNRCIKIHAVLGDDLCTSKLSYQDSENNISLEGGIISENGKPGVSIDKLLKNASNSKVLLYAPDNFELSEEINSIINGKIDESALESTADNLIIPIIEKAVLEEKDTEAALPEYRKLLNKITKQLNQKDISDTIQIENISSDNTVTTYDYFINLTQIALNLTDCILSDEQYTACLEVLGNDSADEISRKIIRTAEREGYFSGKVTVKQGRITHLTVHIPSQNTNITVTIDSSI